MSERLASSGRWTVLSCCLLVACGPSIAERQAELLQTAEDAAIQGQCQVIYELREQAASPDLEEGFRRSFDLLEYACAIRANRDFVLAYQILQGHADSLATAGDGESPAWLTRTQEVMLDSAWALPGALWVASSAGCRGWQPFPLPPWDGRASLAVGAGVPASVHASQLAEARLALCGDTLPEGTRVIEMCGPYASGLFDPHATRVRRGRQQVRYLLKEFRTGVAVADTVMWQNPPPACPSSITFARMPGGAEAISDDRVETLSVRARGDTSRWVQQHWIKNTLDSTALGDWVRAAVQKLDSAGLGTNTARQ